MHAPSQIIWFPRAFGAITGLQICGKILQRGSGRDRGWRQAEKKKKKPLLKCYIKGDEMQELGPSFEGDGP